MHARLVGSDWQCYVPLSLPYPAEEGVQAYSSVALYSFSMTLTAGRSVSSPQLLPRGAFLMTSTVLGYTLEVLLFAVL